MDTLLCYSGEVFVDVRYYDPCFGAGVVVGFISYHEKQKYMLNKLALATVPTPSEFSVDVSFVGFMFIRDVRHFFITSD